jgi:two-component system chemotaxis response regulator CheB
VQRAEHDESNLAPLTCPDCNGNLWEFREGEVLRYRCRVGHTYSLQSLQAAQDDSVERALWAGLRSLEENAVLARRLRKEAEGRGHVHSVQHFNKRVERAEESIRILRGVLERDRVAAEPGEDHEVATTVPESN